MARFCQNYAVDSTGILVGMDYTQSFDVCVSDKHLFVFAANLQKKGKFNPLRKFITPIVTELAPFLIREHQVIYLRDITKLCIDRKYTVGNTFENEIRIAVPEWPAEEQYLRASIFHEMHHLARWQTVGYGQTLGEAMLSEGFATWYEMERTGLVQPWSQASVSEEIKKKAREEWDNSPYGHNNWFYKGTMGRWVGYTLGYNLVRAYLNNTFDLSKSLWTKAEEVRNLL